MTTPRTIACALPARRRSRRSDPQARAAVTPGRLPRVSRLLALALRLDRLVRAGEIADYATLARLGHVSRARVSQILSLALLAPDIQETLLFLPLTERGRDPIRLRQLQVLAALPDWRHQRRLWQELASSLRPGPTPESPKGEMDKWISTVATVEPGS